MWSFQYSCEWNLLLCTCFSFKNFLPCWKGIQLPWIVLNCVCLEISSSPLSILKDNFAGHISLSCQLILFKVWNILSHASLDSQATDEGSDAILRILPFFCKLAFPLTACGIASLLCIFQTLTVMWGVGLLWPCLFGVPNSSCVRIPTCFSVWDIFYYNFVIKLLVIFNFISALSKSPCLRLDPQIKMAILRQQLWTTCSSSGRGGAWRAPPASMPAFWLGWSCACLV